MVGWVSQLVVLAFLSWVGYGAVIWPTISMNSDVIYQTTYRGQSLSGTGYLRWDATSTPKKYHSKAIYNGAVFEEFRFIEDTFLVEYNDNDIYCLNTTYFQGGAYWHDCSEWTAQNPSTSNCSYLDTEGRVIVNYAVWFTVEGKVEKIESQGQLQGNLAVKTINIQKPDSPLPTPTDFNLPSACHTNK